MSTQIKKAAANSTGSRIDQYVGIQLNKTTQQVRFSDIAAGVLTLVAWSLAFFFVVAIVDAWIWPLSRAARFCCLLVFLTGVALIAWFSVLPYFLKKINPEYAAKMIEESKPGFKNSLLNYLALKRDKRSAHRAILNEVSKRAATDLSSVSIDSAVDKSSLIRVGFVLVGLLALATAYMIFSPKSPLPTVMRVLAPGSKIAKPAAVMIQEVTPGDVAVFFGERQEITARVIGKHDPDEVRLVYSSKDSQIVDASVPMEFTGANGIYSVILETGPAGIQQPLHYHIAAVDGVSPQYSIDVRPNPSITINRIKITPPAYTQLPERTIEGYGEIQAVEGSEVEISATANLPIEMAYLVPLVAKDDTVENTEYRELRAISMKSEGNDANGSFVAALTSNRDRPLFTHYKIRFNSENGFQNDRANIYPIRVVADLAPEVEIVEPLQSELAIPVNQPFAVEVWASDLDYEISSVDLRIDHQATEILDKNLHLNVGGQNAGGRVKARVQITPSELSLEPGDKAIMFATASDNRLSPGSKLLDPNVSRTGNYTLIITDPIEEPKKPEEAENGKENTNQDQAEEQKEQNSSDPQNDSGEKSEDQNEQKTGGNSNSEPSDDSQTDSESQDTENESERQEGGAGDSQSTEATDAEQQESQSGGGNSESNTGESDSNSESSSDQQNSSTGSDDGNQANDQSPNQQQNDSPSSQQNGGSEGAHQNENLEENADGSTDSSGGRGNDSNGNQGSATAQDGNNQQGNAGSEEEFRDQQLQNGRTESLSENASQGEQFEKLKEILDKQQQNKNEDSSSDSNSNSRPGDRNGDEESTADSDREHQPQDQPAEPGDENQRQDSSTDPSNQSNSQAGNSEQQPGDPDQGGSQDERSKDGNPEQPVPNGSESENGRPNENQNGSGSKDSDAQESKNDGKQSQQADGEGSPQSESESEQQDSEQEQNSNSQEGASGGDSKSSPENQNQSSSEESQSGESQAQSGSNPTDSQASKSESESPGESSLENSKPSDSNSAASSGSQQEDRSKKGGQPGAGGEQKSSQDTGGGEEPIPDKANLEHTKKVTDLILDKLEDQKYEPDQELLDQMNWTQQELEKFLEQWQQMKENAKTGDVKAKRVYEDALRSLGLNRKTKGRTVKVKKDDPFQLNEDGAVDQIPPEYVDKFNSFLKRRNRSKRK